MSAKRVVLDTNLWIAYLISHRYRDLDDLIESKDVVLLFSEELLREFIDVASRPKFSNYFSVSEIEALLSLFFDFAEFVDVQTSVDVCRDKKDNFLLNLCIDGNADFLVSGDKDLLILDSIERTKIVTFAEFVDTF